MNVAQITPYAYPAAAFVVGAALGSLIARKVVSRKMRRQTEEEIESIKQAYRRLAKTDEFSTPASAVQAINPETDVEVAGYHEVVETNEYTEPPAAQETPLVRTNIFSTYKAPEDPLGGSGEPFLIAKDDFFNSEVGYEQQTLTYYEEDDTLVDENEELIDDSDRLVGNKNLGVLGSDIHVKLSGDPLVAYIRNERMAIDYEVIRETGSYLVIVQGMDPKVLKDDPPRPLKMRRERDD